MDYRIKWPQTSCQVLQREKVSVLQFSCLFFFFAFKLSPYYYYFLFLHSLNLFIFLRSSSHVDPLNCYWLSRDYYDRVVEDYKKKGN